MGKGSNLYFQQQQARQLREMEKHQAAQSGQPLRKLSWTERNVLGLKEEPSSLSSEPGPGGESMLVRAREEAEVRRRDREQEKRARKAATARGAEGVPLSAESSEGAPRMEVRGYMIDVTWDRQTLTVTASNKVSSVALRGPDHGKGPLRLQGDEIESTELKPASALTNGRITILTRAGETYLLHFRRKSNAEFARLYKALPG